MPMTRLVPAATLLLLFASWILAFMIGEGSAQAWAPANAWRGWGQGSINTRSSDQGCINKAYLQKWGFVVRWRASVPGGVSATPTVCNGALYFPDWAGNLHSYNATTGAKIWSTTISALLGVPGTLLSRNSPTVNDDCSVLYLGSYAGVNAHMLAVDASTGVLIWKQQLDSHPRSAVTQSPTFLDGSLYVGLASSEETRGADATCCTFRGSFMKINASTGSISWRTFLTPATDGWAGAAVWGSSPSVSASRGLVYIGTGNNYKVPASYSTCVNAAVGWEAKQRCNPATNYVDSVLALNLTDGRIVWNQLLVDTDVWTATNPLNGDYDFAQQPILVGNRVVAGQKSGWVWSLDAATGTKVWDGAAYPASTSGALMWGSASDGTKFYYGTHWWDATQSGYLGSKVIATGAQAWFYKHPTGGKFFGAVTHANGLVFAPSMDGKLYVVDANTGTLVTAFDTGSPTACGPSIANRAVYVGTAYRAPTPSTLFALDLPGPSPSLATCPACGVLYGDCCPKPGGGGTCLDGQDAFCETDINKCYRNCGRQGQICCEKQGFCYSPLACRAGTCQGAADIAV